jgi:class 3 adenylate cyclase
VEERTAEVVAQSKEIEGQKGRIEDLLLNILPKEISEELKDKGKATARRHDEVTVLFTDMKGFTQVAEKMTPEELVNELDECFIQFDEIVGRYGIEKIKTIGDSYMCAAGVPQAIPTTPINAYLPPWRSGPDGTLAQGAGSTREATPWVLAHRLAQWPGGGRGGGQAQIRLRHLGRYGEHRQPYGEQWCAWRSEHQWSHVRAGEGPIRM